MLSALSAKVTLADGSEEVLDAARILSGEVAGVSLAMADGSELALNVPGSFGNNRGWKLTFDKLPAGATVTVDYTLTVDRAAYVAAGGDLDSVVTFRNAFAVSPPMALPPRIPRPARSRCSPTYRRRASSLRANRRTGIP